MVIDGPNGANRRQETGIRLLGAGAAQGEKGDGGDGESVHGEAKAESANGVA
jgi:hypothetical protein